MKELSKTISQFLVLRNTETNNFFYTDWIQEFQGGYESAKETGSFDYFLEQGTNCIYFHQELAAGMCQHYQEKFGLELEVIRVIKEITYKTQPQGWR